MVHPLTRYRQEKGLSVEAMAKLAGTTRQTIHRIEKGRQTPSIDMAEKLIAATASGVTAAELMPALEAFRQRHEAAA